MATKRLPRPRDPIQLGKLIVDIATGQVEDRADSAKSTKRRPTKSAAAKKRQPTAGGR